MAVQVYTRGNQKTRPVEIHVQFKGISQDPGRRNDFVMFFCFVFLQYRVSVICYVEVCWTEWMCSLLELDLPLTGFLCRGCANTTHHCKAEGLLEHQQDWTLDSALSFISFSQYIITQLFSWSYRNLLESSPQRTLTSPDE